MQTDCDVEGVADDVENAADDVEGATNILDDVELAGFLGLTVGGFFNISGIAFHVGIKFK